MIHELAYKIYAEAPDRTVFDGLGDVGVVTPERGERPSVVENFDHQPPVIEP
jgi:hypothetical protein